MTTFVKDDGGRPNAGFKGSAGDCVTRAIAIASGMPYSEVYAAMAKGTESERGNKKGRTARSGIKTTRRWFKKWMEAHGFEWTPTMKIGTGCKVHLNANELPKGRLVVAVSKHYTAMIDGIIHDTFDPRERGVTIYPPNTPSDELPAKARFLGNGQGWAYEPERCVYGYWTFKSK